MFYNSSFAKELEYRQESIPFTRQRKTSYDPDYDRSVTFRSRHDSENERKIMLMSGDQGGSGVGAGARHR